MTALGFCAHVFPPNIFFIAIFSHGRQNSLPSPNKAIRRLIIDNYVLLLFAISRSSNFLILPVDVFGRLANTTLVGALKRAI
jgi:hypothetical protein